MYRLGLGDRMKRYENAYNYYITPRSFVIMRLDGKGFSKLTKKLKLEKPFSPKFISWMANSAKVLAKEIQGCSFGYTQSDEMSFVFDSAQSLEADPWFGNRIQKIVSISSSIITAVFNRQMWKDNDQHTANFDCRIFVVPSAIEVYNYMVWRQQDCIKNSISSATYYLIGEKLGRGTTRNLIHNLNGEQRKALLLKECNKDWNDFPAEFKYGTSIIKISKTIKNENGETERRVWEAIPSEIINDPKLVLSCSNEKEKI